MFLKISLKNLKTIQDYQYFQVHSCGCHYCWLVPVCFSTAAYVASYLKILSIKKLFNTWKICNVLINFSLLQIISLTFKLIYYLLSGKYYTQFESVVSITCLLAWVLGWFFCGFGFFLSHQSLPLHLVRNSAPFSLLQLQQVRNLISPLHMLSSCPAFYMLRTVIWTRQEVIKASSADPGSWFTVLVPCFCPYLYILPPSLQRQHIL